MAGTRWDERIEQVAMFKRLVVLTATAVLAAGLSGAVARAVIGGPPASPEIASTEVISALDRDQFKVLLNSQASRTGVGSGPDEGVLVLGDSLILPIGGRLADRLAQHTGASAEVVVSSGSAVPNWVNPGWLEQPLWGGPPLRTIGDHVGELAPRATVIALGSNDARVMTSHPDGYGPYEHAVALTDALAHARSRSRSRCVFMVNVADHWSQAGAAAVDAVNVNIARAAEPADVYEIDWAAASAGRDEWFAPDGPEGPDIHLSPEGERAYSDLIADNVLDRIDSGAC